MNIMYVKILFVSMLNNTCNINVFHHNILLGNNVWLFSILASSTEPLFASTLLSCSLSNLYLYLPHDPTSSLYLNLTHVTGAKLWEKNSNLTYDFVKKIPFGPASPSSLKDAKKLGKLPA